MVRATGFKEYVRNRAIQSIATLFVTISLNFFLFHILPGDPVRLMYRDPRMTEEMIATATREFGLDKPLYMQFFIYVVNTLEGNLGISYSYHAPVAGIVMGRLWNSVVLIGGAAILAISIGSSAGVLAAWKRGKRIDKFLVNFSLGMNCMPVFWLAMLMIVVFAVEFRFFPTSGMSTYATTFTNPFDYLSNALWHMALPLITVAICWLGTYCIIMRSSMVDVLTEDYMLTAKAKGLSDREMIKDHAMRNALLPLVTLIAVDLGMVVGGGVQAETVFAWPGIGRLMYDALIRRDYPVLQGTFLVLAISVIVANFIADILYSYLDPRVRT
jgi:peptide/nickel transport system permease protein